jgi:hypothetical protein
MLSIVPNKNSSHDQEDNAPHSQPVEPRYLVLFGIAALVLALISTLTGETLTRGPMVNRAEDPKTFWWAVASWYLVGIFLIGLAYLS